MIGWNFLDVISFSIFAPISLSFVFVEMFSSAELSAASAAWISFLFSSEFSKSNENAVSAM